MYTLNKIIALTESQGKSQKELTDYLGLKRGTFTAWKAGHNSSYKKHLPEIAQFLGVSVSYLVGDERQTEKSSPVVTEEDLMVALFNGDKEVSPEAWEEVVDFARYVREKYKNKKRKD